ncbi:glycosyltransferase [Tenacibaculum sp.]|nr:glycosyltransferase [Tenacibaculum sp.]
MNKINPIISVIIPTYNRAYLLKETIDSVLNQTFNDFELIIVDDGSTDDTEQLILSYDEDITYIKIVNSGQSRATNIGINASKAEYIALLDSDDLWDRSFLETSYETLLGNASYGFCFCNYSYFDKNKVISEKYLEVNRQVSGDLFPYVLEGQFICIGSFLIKKEYLIVVGLYDEEIPVANDWDLWLRISHKYNGIYIDESLFKLRQHNNRISKNGFLMAKCNIKILKSLKTEFSEEHNKYRNLLTKIEAKNYRVIAGTYRKKGKLLLATFYYLKVLFYKMFL